MKKIVLLIALGLSLFSCSNNVDLAIDNPTDLPVIVKVDTLTVEIPPREVVWVEMGKGEHQITLENDSVVKFNFQNSLYMINPTLSEYLKYEEFYGNAMSQSMYGSSIPLKTVSFLGTEFEGNFEVVRDLINPVTWDCGPRESLPEIVEVEEGDSYATLTKLCDVKEFIEMVQSAPQPEPQMDIEPALEQ
ncbi:hypothetical protein J2X31_001104 [Flavobacterium arsenatis]|uniref:Lipoprotein n=1 Tax=Flavobacterium arsenatis TaxID=1484332 RepID=A0ABU1TMA5_9FLAO|nr:hypothetical protein [Flavobacterium arsenatis]MDR6967097.1 hypothetical protein [Flavobacterium arsenatis]